MQPLSRMTPATLDVLATLLDEPEATWGLRIVARTGRPTGSVYPILERLERAADGESAPDPGSLPSGDVIAREFQRFLRQRGNDA